MHIIPLEAQATCPCKWLPEDPQAADTYIRQELAMVLAKKTYIRRPRTDTN